MELAIVLGCVLALALGLALLLGWVRGAFGERVGQAKDEAAREREAREDLARFREAERAWRDLSPAERERRMRERAQNLAPPGPPDDA